MINIIGDVHLGKKFIDNVPLHRRGEREKLVLEQFISDLALPGKFTVQMGDLFDSFAVPNEVLWDAYEAIIVAAQANPRAIYFLRGNHDATRDSNKISSWEILAIMFRDWMNVKFISEPIIKGDYGFMPWDPYRSAQEQAESLDSAEDEKLKAVFCHCDIKSYGGDDFNLLPFERLSKITDHVYTGHIHLPQEFERDGLKVTVTGSMQPYAHGEDPGTEWYVTVSKQELEAIQVPEVFKNKYVRVVIGEDEEPPEPIDCLGFSVKKILPGPKDEGDTTSMEVNLSGLNSTELLRSCLQEVMVSDKFIEKILEKFVVAQSGN